MCGKTVKVAGPYTYRFLIYDHLIKIGSLRNGIKINMIVKVKTMKFTQNLKAELN